MGRDAGHIALNSGIAIGAQEILIPEQKTLVWRNLIDFFKGRVRKQAKLLALLL